jgi:hypothetical protein
MGPTPSLRGHHLKSYAINEYLMKGLTKLNVKIHKRLKLLRKRKAGVWKDIVQSVKIK